MRCVPLIRLGAWREFANDRAVSQGGRLRRIWRSPWRRITRGGVCVGTMKALMRASNWRSVSRGNSVGDYVLNRGELAALVMIDAAAAYPRCARRCRLGGGGILRRRIVGVSACIR